MKQLFFLFTLMLLPGVASAYDDKIDNIYYNFDESAKTAQVTYMEFDADENRYAYSGAVDIPSSVTYKGEPYSVTSIDDEAFDGCFGLTSISIPNSVTYIGAFAFNQCTGLTSVTIPNSVTNLKFCTFYHCESLTSITIPNSVTTIGEYAFAGCYALTTVKIPNSVTTIGKAAFMNCNSLTSVTSFILLPYKIEEEVFTSYNSATLYVLKGTKWKYEGTAPWNMFQKIEEIDLTAVEIDGIYYNLNTETMEAEVTNSKGGVYEGGRCYSGSVDIPPTVSFYGIDFRVTAIGYQAFVDCEGLTSITIPNSVTSIGGYAFWNCSGLTSITIPNSVTSIEELAFWNCRGLTSVTIPGSVKSLGRYVFYECTGLTSAKFESGVTSISNGTFSCCNYLSSVTIPEGVTSIGADAFNRCWYLTSITIPKSVKSLGTLFLFLCERLTSITSLITEPFEIEEEEVFWVDDGLFATCPLYVPKGTKAKYEATPVWNKFKTIEEIVIKGDVNGDGTVDVADIGSIIDAMAKGTDDPEADVNKDGGVDVADIAIVIDIMAGKVVDTPDEQAYPGCPNNAHPHWIDLGLPSGTQWRCCNEGASKPEDYGSYYTFDEAQAYNPPSLDQINELFDNSTSEWTTQNGVNGWMFKSKVNYASVFLPAAGAVWGGETDGDAFFGDYWSSKLSESNQRNAYYLEFGSAGASWNNIGNRNGGQSVRSVRKN